MPALNALEEQVSVSNQNVAQAEAQYRQARAAVSVARASLFPTVDRDSGDHAPEAATVTRTRFRRIEPDRLHAAVQRVVGAGPLGKHPARCDGQHSRPPSRWRRTWGMPGCCTRPSSRRTTSACTASTGKSELLTRTQASYEEYLTLTRNRFSAGIASDLDVAQAEAQLYAVQAQLMDLGVQRAAFEHAIAILIGKAPAELTIPPVALTGSPPPVPLGVPSELLERRPDIASAERQVAAANEQIGIAMAAFYPNLNLTGSAGLSRARAWRNGSRGPAASGPSGRNWRPRCSTQAAAAGSWRNSRPPTTRPWPPIGRPC